MDISTLYKEANDLYGKAVALQSDGEEMSPEKLQKVNDLLDQVEAKTNQAKTLERANSMRTSLPLSSQREEEGMNKAFDLGHRISEPVKAMAGMFGIEPKITPFILDDKRRYDPDLDTKHRIASLLYWQYGEKNFDRVLGAMPKAFANMGVEMKDLAAAQGAAGGYLVADSMLARLVEIQAQQVRMRQIASVLPPVPGGSVIFPSEDTALSDAEWTSEIATGSDDTVTPFGQRSLTPHPLAKRIKISRTLLRAASLLNVEAWVLNRLARKFNEAEENAFINGSGAQQAEGLLNASGVGTTSTAASNTLAADDIINWAYALGSAYAGGATILCNRSFIRKVRLLKGSDNNYLWQPGLAQGSPSTILDWPYVDSDFYPTGLVADAYVDNAKIATIGDFSYYWIVDSLNFEVQRLEELYAASNQVGFIGRKETDGMVVDSSAFRHLVITP